MLRAVAGQPAGGPGSFTTLTLAAANGKIGQATLVAGTVTVPNTSVTTNSRIFITVSNPGGTRGFLSTSKSAGVSFTVTSSSGAETSTVDWLIVEQS